MGTAPIVELARAYGLHPRLRLLVKGNCRTTVDDHETSARQIKVTYIRSYGKRTMFLALE